MYLAALSNPTKKKRKRIARGISAGGGKTGGRGGKGQTARTGGKIPVTFEGGQTPLFMKLPRAKGFKNPNHIVYQVINVSDLEKLSGDAVTVETLAQARLIRRKLPVKLLGDGELKRKFTVTLDKVSLSAKEKIEKAGGTVSAP